MSHNKLLGLIKQFMVFIQTRIGFIFLSFFLWRIVDLLIAFIAKSFDHYDEHFLYKFQLYHYSPYIPKFLISFANFDGAHYLHIAHDGYKQFEQAFFPLFPLSIRILSTLFADFYFLPGFFLSNSSFLIGLYFFKKYLEEIGKKTDTIVWIYAFLLLFPTSFFFGAVYTEGLFFLLVTSSLYFSQTKQYKFLLITSALAGLTRLMGLFLIIPIFTIIVFGQYNFKLRGKSFKENAVILLDFLYLHKSLVAISFAPLLGFLSYIIYLAFATHNPLSFYSSLNAFNTGRTTTHIIFLPQIYYRYMHIFLVAKKNIIYLVAFIEFIIFNLFFFVLVYDFWQLWKQKHSLTITSLIGLNLFSLVNLLLPTLTGTFTSLPRYVLLSLSFFICIAQIRNMLIRIILLFIFLILHIILLSLFIQGYFVG